MAYFIPEVRHLAGVVLGAALLPPRVFARFAYAGALIWSASFIGLGYVAGEEWHQLVAILHRTLIAVAVLSLFILGSAVTMRRIRRAKL